VTAPSSAALATGTAAAAATVLPLVAAARPAFEALAERIFGLAETRFQEHRSAAALAEALAAAGFRVTSGIAGLATAFVAEYGSGTPVVAFLGEYDALPGLSQAAGVAEPRPAPGRTTGHGCGHHLIGTAAALAAVAVARAIAAGEAAGTVRYYGCPAEEGGSGKTFMVRAGAFDGVDAALGWHPDAFTGVTTFDNLATLQLAYRFTGRASHAALTPHLGRSALDAVELMNVGANYLREHVPPEARFAYAITDAGGGAPQVVPASAEVRYLLRAPEADTVEALRRRVDRLAEGAALMTETTVEARVERGSASLLANETLEAVLRACVEVIGPPRFDAEDRRAAETFRATLPAEAIAEAFAEFDLPSDPSLPLYPAIVPPPLARRRILASSDIGDVSRVAPTAQIYVACWAVGTPYHSWQMVAQGTLPAALKGMGRAAEALAAAGLALLRDPALVTAAGGEHRRRSAARPYRCPLPDDVAPPV